MASKWIEVGLLYFVLMLSMLSIGAMAQQNCMNTILSMASCLNYVTGSSTTPPVSCCSSLANVVQTQPQCLCTVLNGGAQLGVSINTTLALSLPTACKVQTPPVSRCNETSPGPAGSADGTADSPTPSVTGSKTTPASATPSSGSVTKIHVKLTAFLLFLVAYATKFSSF